MKARYRLLARTGKIVTRPAVAVAKRPVKIAATGVAVASGAALGTAAGAVYLARRSRRRDLTGQVAVVTGGSRGLGLAVACELARAGCRLVIAARDPGELDAAEHRLRAAGAEVVAVECDVTDEAQVRRMVSTALARYGRIDVLVNNAGIIQVGPVEALTSKNFREAVDTMLFGMVHATLEVLPSMRERRSGHIVNITSIGGKVSAPHLLPYGTAKFATVGFSDGLRSEVAKDGIRVTTVVPGLMRTGSDVQAEFAGDASAEYAWFGVAAATPGLSMSASRAAKAIVRAMAAGRTQLVLTGPARLGALAHGVAPGAVQGALAAVNRLLPNGSGGTGGTVPGIEAAAGVSDAVRKATVLNRRSAADLNQPAPS